MLIKLFLTSENDVNAAFLYDNILRRELDLVQSVLVYERLLEVESIKAKERQKQGRSKLTEAGRSRRLRRREEKRFI